MRFAGRKLPGRGSAGKMATPLLMALIIWLCVLPLLALVVLPWFGWTTTLYAAAVLLLLDLLACWLLCIFRTDRNKM